MSTTTLLLYRLRIVAAMTLLLVGFISSANASIINTSKSNIRHNGVASYSPKGGLQLTFAKSGMDSEDKKAMASGKFVVTENIVLTPAECKSLNAPAGTMIKKGEYNITPTSAGCTCVIPGSK